MHTNKSRRRLIAMTLGSAAFSGCATRKPEVHPHPTMAMYQPKLKTSTIFHPAVGSEATVEVGTNMAFVTRATQVPELELLEALRHRLTHHGQAMLFETYAGTKALLGTSHDGDLFGEGNLKVSYENAKTKVWEFDHLVPGGIVAHRDGNRYLWWRWDGYPIYIDWVKGLQAPVKTKTVAAAGPALRRELVYGGVSQGTVSVLYREFVNDMARPAFSQELRYDLAQGRVIGYQGARFEIIKADNTGLTYRVISHLDAPAG